MEREMNMNTSVFGIKKIEDAKRNNYSIEQNIFNSIANAVVPVESMQILVPVGVKNEICNTSIRSILRPINENTNHIAPMQYTKFPIARVFSPRKQNIHITKEKNKQPMIPFMKKPEETFSTYVNPNSSSSTTTMEIFPSSTKQTKHPYTEVRYNNDKTSYSSFGTHLGDDRMNQLLLDSNLFSKYTEVDTNSTCSTFEQMENLDYSMSFIAKNKNSGTNQDMHHTEKIYQGNKRSNFHEKPMSNLTYESQNYTKNNFTKFDSPIRPVINYNTIHLVQHNNYNNASKIIRKGDGEVSKSYDYHMNNKEPIHANNIETLPEWAHNVIADTTLTNLNSVCATQNHNVLKTIPSIVQKQENETEIILNNTMSISEMIEQSTKQQLDSMNPEIPMNHSVRKGKKKTMGACFFNLPCFSCQFLMTCNKT